MAYSKDILLGRISKVNGYEGAVAVKLEKNFIENIPRLESVFLEIEGRPVPFFLSFSEYNGADILKMKFDGYDSINKIKEFVGCRVFLTTSGRKGKAENEITSLHGFNVLSGDDKLVGSIKEVLKNPGQWILNIQSQGNNEILIPFHEDFIVSIDKKKRIIVMNIPEGLTEIN